MTKAEAYKRIEEGLTVGDLRAVIDKADLTRPCKLCAQFTLGQWLHHISGWLDGFADDYEFVRGTHYDRRRNRWRHHENSETAAKILFEYDR